MRAQTLVPTHVGIIMDGNGRWALANRFSRLKGHTKGVQTTKKICLAAIQAGVRYLTLYTFSTENWKRSAEEVEHLMELLAWRLREEYSFFRENNICVSQIGDIDRLPATVQKEINRVTQESKDNDAINVQLAVNYGGQDEIVRAANLLIEQGHTTLTPDLIDHALDTALLPPVDLIIRTGNHYRISNFLLWHAAYAELYFSEKLWPDWTEDDFNDALAIYAQRCRTFGA